MTITTTSKLQMPTPKAKVGRAQSRHLQLMCAACFHELPAIDLTNDTVEIICQCGAVIANVDGIWRALAPDRREHFRKFVEEYERIRSVEARGSSTPEFYLRLPYQDLTGRNRWQWCIRAQSFRFFDRRGSSHSDRRKRRSRCLINR